MSNLEIGIFSFPALMVLIFLRVPIGLAMFSVGFAGLWMVNGSTLIALAKLKTETFTTFSNYSLSIVPMFLLMGHFATLGGMSQALFKAAEGWLGHRKGGVAMAAIGACAGFGAIWPQPPRWGAWPCQSCGNTAMRAGLPPRRWRRVARWAF